jgi:hypothetical protein
VTIGISASNVQFQKPLFVPNSSIVYFQPEQSLLCHVLQHPGRLTRNRSSGAGDDARSPAADGNARQRLNVGGRE